MALSGHGKSAQLVAGTHELVGLAHVLFALQCRTTLPAWPGHPFSSELPQTVRCEPLPGGQKQSAVRLSYTALGRQLEPSPLNPGRHGLHVRPNGLLG